MTSSPSEAFEVFDREIGGFARMFPRSRPDELAEAFVARDLVQVQLNLSALGLPTVPDAEALAGIDLAGIAHAFSDRGRIVWGVSVTYNMAHPDEAVRIEQTERAARYIAALGATGATAASLCTGTRSPDSMWTKHPDNQSEQAWAAMLDSLRRLLPAAEEAGMLLGIEPEPANVVADAGSALRLVAALGPAADQIGFILDPANLISEVIEEDRTIVLREAFTALGPRTICVHAKDLLPWPDAIAGHGAVDYKLVMALHAGLPRTVPLIIQDAAEADVAGVRALLRSAITP